MSWMDLIVTKSILISELNLKQIKNNLKKNRTLVHLLLTNTFHTFQQH